MDLSAFDFELPDECIATRPAEPRDSCRLLCVCGDEITDRVFRDIRHELREGDLLIANDTRVVPALLFGVRPARDDLSSDVDVQINLVAQKSDGVWKCFGRPGRRLRPDDVIEFPAGLRGRIIDKLPSGELMLEFSPKGADFWGGVEAVGKMPIPPYIAKMRPADSKDHEDYQTVFADRAGSVAAPTAGLHFTDELIAQLQSHGVGFERVTLHVGAGTFAGLSEEAFKTGRLHEEWCEISEEVALKIADCKARGGRVIAVGTTSLRTLESLADGKGGVLATSRDTDIFIQPGYKFQVVDGLITNFHLPKSSLFMLVSALMGTEVMQSAYAHAINSGYKFYSYGDASLLMPRHD